MPNMASIISSHNRRIINSNERITTQGCNCRGGSNNCILQGHCQTSNFIYKCTVTTASGNKEYIGLTANSFKQRYTAHKSSYNNIKNRNSTALSSHIWDLKSSGTPHTVSWNIQRLAPPYSRESKVCQLCLTEKTLICPADPANSLNKRNEIMSKCRHRAKHLLSHW